MRANQLRHASLANQVDDDRENETKEEIVNKRNDCVGDKDKDGEQEPIGNHASPTHIASVLLESKKKMQSPTENNGITCALIGSSGSGKSTLLRDVFLNDIYEERADKEYVVTVFTESPQCDAFQHLPKKVNVDGAGVDLNMINWMYQMNATYDRKYSFVTILDDCIHIRYKSQIEKMFLVMRNTNITSVVSLQYANLIPRSIRTSVYFIFCMHQNTLEGVDLMVVSFLSAYIPGGNKNEKMDYYMSWTQNHRFFLIDNLNHKAYQVDENYECKELEVRTSVSMRASGEDGALLGTVPFEEAESGAAQTLTSRDAPPSHFKQEEETKKRQQRQRPQGKSRTNLSFDPRGEDAATGTVGARSKSGAYPGSASRGEEAAIARSRAVRDSARQEYEMQKQKELSEKGAKEQEFIDRHKEELGNQMEGVISGASAKDFPRFTETMDVANEGEAPKDPASFPTQPTPMDNVETGESAAHFPTPTEHMDTQPSGALPEDFPRLPPRPDFADEKIPMEETPHYSPMREEYPSPPRMDMEEEEGPAGPKTPPKRKLAPLTAEELKYHDKKKRPKHQDLTPPPPSTGEGQKRKRPQEISKTKEPEEHQALTKKQKTEDENIETAIELLVSDAKDEEEREARLLDIANRILEGRSKRKKKKMPPSPSASFATRQTKKKEGNPAFKK